MNRNGDRELTVLISHTKTSDLELDWPREADTQDPRSFPQLGGLIIE